EAVDIVPAVGLAVNLAQLLRQVRVQRVGQLVEGSDRLFMKKLTEAVVTWDPALAVAHHVDRRQINGFDFVGRGYAVELPQKVREIVNGDGAWIGDPERVDDVCHRPPWTEDTQVLQLTDNTLLHLECGQRASVFDRPHLKL